MSALSELAKYYEIYVFTSATKEYATKIMKLLDPEKKILKGALSRKHCYRTKNGIYIKDLGIVSNKNIKEMLIIDNLSYSFSFQIDNGIPILSWYDDPNDCELKHLTKYLIKIANLEDLRKPNRQVFKLSELSQKKINEIIYL